MGKKGWFGDNVGIVWALVVGQGGVCCWGKPGGREYIVRACVVLV